MDRYEEFDSDQIQARIARFADQVEQRLAGEITEDQFRPLRRANGVTLEPHSYMLRIGLPKSGMNARQLRVLAHVARRYDKGYCHFTAHRTVEFRWPALVDIPRILADLAAVELQAAEIVEDRFRDETADSLADVAVDAGGLQGAVSAEQLELLADTGLAKVRPVDTGRSPDPQYPREPSHVDEAKAA